MTKSAWSLAVLALFIFCAFSACSSGSDDDIPDGDSDSSEVEDGDSENTEEGDGDVEETPDGDTEEITEEDVENSEEDSEGVENDGDDINIPESTVHVVRTPSNVVPDEVYQEEKPTFYRTTDVLPELNVTALKQLGALTMIGTTNGLYAHDPLAATVFIPIAGPGSAGEVRDIYGNTSDNRLLYIEGAQVKFANPVAKNKAGSIAIDVPGATPLCVIEHNNTVFVGTSAGLGLIFEEAFAPIEAVSGFEVRAMVADANGLLYLATSAGVKTWDGDALTDVSLPEGFENAQLVDIAATSGGADIIAATDIGLAKVSGEKKAYLPQKGGIATDHINSLTISGDMWLMGHSPYADPDDESGTTIIGGGATAVFYPDDNGTFGHVDHYISQRWLPSNDVKCVAIDQDGNRWIGTSQGISVIKLVNNTLAQKMEYFQKFLDDYYWRMDGFVSSDMDSEDEWSVVNPHLSDKDNDGLWTQMMIGGWCYAYAVTGEERFYEAARKAMNNMEMEVDVPAADFEAAGLGRGFVTRSLVRDDEGEVYTSKATQSNWHLTEYEGRSYYWKDDTSSDEIDGHFYGYPLFYDICAKTDEEKASIAEHASAIASYIMDHGYYLIDLDGQKTTHGHWAPEYIGGSVHGNDCIDWCQSVTDWDIINCAAQCVESGAGSGWLNGMQILGTLLSTWHMTGDDKFYRAYEDFITEYKYDQLIMFHKGIVTVTNRHMANHSDHELAILAYHTLIRYEPNADRRQNWIDSLNAFLEYEIKERNPLWEGIRSLSSGESEYAEDAVETLRLIPEDLRDVYINQKHRKDYEVDKSLDRFDEPQFTEVPPYDEIRLVWWNGNMYSMIDGGSGRNYGGPMAWLLAYWTMRYAGIIVDANE